VSVVVCESQDRGHPVAQPSYYSLGVEKVTGQLDGGSRVGGPLAGGWPMYELGLGDGEGNSKFATSISYFCEGRF